jgi:hypothetical protein
MKRMILVLTVSAMLLIGSALPALAWHEETGDPSGAPENPDCEWYGPFGGGPGDHEAWWEYWCFWPHWGWEFVFWVWAT